MRRVAFQTEIGIFQVGRRLSSSLENPFSAHLFIIGIIAICYIEYNI